MTVSAVFVKRLNSREVATLNLEFGGVREFSFSHDCGSFYSYVVEDYKLLEDEKGFYLSLDPDSMADKALSSDCDIIRFDTVESSSEVHTEKS